MTSTYMHILDLVKEAGPPLDGILSRTIFQDDLVKAVVFGFGQPCDGRFDVLEEFRERGPISFRDKSNMCECVAQMVEDWPRIGHEFYSSDDDGDPLIPFTTMMLMAQAVD